MEYKEFKRHIGKAGLSAKEFARLIRVQPSSVTNFKQKNEVPKCMAIIAVLMGEMADKHIDYRKVVEELDVQPQMKKPNAFGRNKNIESEHNNE